MKKILMGFVCLALGGGQLSVFAQDPTPAAWDSLSEAVSQNYSIAVPNNIIAPTNASSILNTTSNTAVTVAADIYIQGPQGVAVFVNSNKMGFQGNGAYGTGYINSYSPSTLSAIQNNKTAVFANNIQINGGVDQSSDSSAVIQIGGWGSNPVANPGKLGVTFSGANNILAGTIRYADTTQGYLNIDGGVVGSGTTIEVSAGNLFRVAGGNVTLNGSGAGIDTWDGTVDVSSGVAHTSGTGTLTLDNVTHISQDGNYTQSGSGSNLILQNGSILSSTQTISTITGGQISILDSSVLNLENSLSTNVSGINIASGNTLATLNISNGSSAVTALTLNGGSVQGGVINIGPFNGNIQYPNSGNTLTVGADAVIGADATVNIYADNNLVVSAGTATLKGLQGTWDGSVEVQGTGTLNLDALSHGDGYTQTGGTLNLINGSDLILQTDSITTASGSTSVINLGGVGSTGTLTLGGGSITTAASGGVTKVNIGNGSNGNSLYVIEPSSKITNGSSGTTKVNIGVGGSTGNSLNLQTGSIEGFGTTVTIGTTTAGSAGNSLIVSGTGTINENSTLIINTGNTLAIQGGVVEIEGTAKRAPGPDGQNVWNGTIALSGGVLTLDGFNYERTGTNGQYLQTGGTLNLAYMADLILDSTSSITGGNLVFAGEFQKNLNILNVTGGTVGEAAVVHFEAFNQMNISSGDVTLNGTITGSTPYVADTWKGAITLSGTGSLTLDAFNSTGADSNGLFNQTGGTLNLTDGAQMTIANSGVITNTTGASTVNIGLGSTTGSSLILTQGSISDATGTGTTVNIGTTDASSSGNSLTISGTAILQESAKVVINAGNSLNISGGGATLNGTITGLTPYVADVWNGSVNVTGGDFTLDKFTHLTANGAYNQTSGNFALDNNSNFTISDSNSAITTDGSGSGTTTVTIGLSSGVPGSSLTLAGNSILKTATAGDSLIVYVGLPITTGNSLNVAGGTLDSTVQVSIYAGNSLNVTDGNATLNGAGDSLTVDTWSGTVNLSGTGNLTLDNITQNTANGAYLQTGGTLSLVNNAKLTLASGSSITDGTVNVAQAGTSLTFNNGVTNAAQLNLSNGTVTVSSGSTLNTAATANVLTGGSLVANGTFNFANTDTETVASAITGTGTVGKTASGTLNFTTDQSAFSGTYTQTAGTVNVSNNFFTGTNNLDSGTLNILPSGSVTLSGGRWGNLAGTDGTDISNTGGILTLSGLSHTASSTTGTYNQNNGMLNLTNGSNLTLTYGSVITTDGSGTDITTINIGSPTGTDTSSLTLNTGNTLATATGTQSEQMSLIVNIGSGSTGNSLNIAGGTLDSSTWVRIVAGNSLNLLSGSATLNSDMQVSDIWTGTVNVSGGTLTLSGMTSNGIYNQTGGATNLSASSTLTLLDNSNLGGGTLTNAGTVNLSNTGAQTIATQFTGTGTINKNAAGNSTFTAENSGFLGTYNQTAGTATIQNNFFAGTNNLTGGTVTIATGGSLTLNAGDNWAATTVSNTGGTVILDAFSHDATSAGTYTQASGALSLNNSSNLILGASSSITGGTVGYVGTGSTLEVATNSSFASGATLNLSSGNSLNVSGGTVALNGTGAGADTWAGAVNVGGGTLALSSITSNGVLTQTAGATTIGGASLITIGPGSVFTGGTVAFSGVGNTLAVSTSSTFGPNTILTLNTANNFNVTGGVATLNSNDSWSGLGAVNLTSGNLVLDGVTTNGVYTQNGGSLALSNASGAVSTLTVGTGSLINNGTVGFVGTGNTLNVTTGGTFASVVALTLNTDNNFNLTGGTATLNANDTWSGAGSVLVNGGTLTLDGIVSNGTYCMSGGTTNLTTGTTLNYGNTSSLGGGTFANAGTLNISHTNQNYVGTNFTGNGVINKNGTGETIFTTNGQNFTGTYTQTAGTANIQAMADNATGTFFQNAVKNLTGGNIIVNSGTALTIKATDNWTNTNIANTGLFTLDHVTQDTSVAGTYNQTNGNTILTNGSALTLGTGSGISAGNVDYIGTGNTLTVATGATVASNAVVNLTAGNTFTVNGGTATLNGTSTGTDTWSALGTANVFGGTLNLNSITSNGIFSISAGTMNIASDSAITYRDGSTIGGGTINVAGTLNIANSSAQSVGTVFSGAGTINQNGSSTTTYTTNGLGFTGTYNQTSGAVILAAAGSFFGDATKNLTGGSLDIANGTSMMLKSTDTWTTTTITNEGLLTLNGFTHNLITSVGYNQTAAGSLILTGGSTLSLGAGSAITDGNMAFVGTGNTLNIKTGATFTPNFAFDITADNNFNVKGGTAVLDDADTVWSGNVSISSGTLALNDITVHGAYNQSGGITTINSVAALTLSSTNSSLTGGLLLNAGTINFNEATVPTVVATRIGSTTAGGGVINKNGTGEIIFTADNSGFTGTYHQTLGKATISNNFFTGTNDLTGGTVEIKTNGNVILNAGDNWTNTNITNNGGTLDLGISHNTTAAGTFTQAAGTTTLNSGSTLTLKDSNINLNGGVFFNNGILNLDNGTNRTVATSLSGNGRINKDGAGTLLLTGQNLTYTGDLWVNNGTVDFNVASGLTDSYISGTTHLNGGSLNLAYDRSGLFTSPVDVSGTSTLNLNTNSNLVISTSNNISGAGTVNKSGAGEYRVYAGSNGTVPYSLNVNEGTMTVVADTATNFSSPVTVTSSALNVLSSGTNFNDGLTLSHGYLGILNGGFNVNKGLTVGSTINTMNNEIATNNITGNLTVGTSGTADFLIDISPYAGTSDKYAISGQINKLGATGVINVTDFKIIGPPTLLQSLNLKIFAAAGGIVGVDFASTDKTIKSALGLYGLSSLGGGDYLLSWKDFNPQVFRGQVATESAYANQLTTNNILFDHIGLVSEQLLSSDKPNVYANSNPLFAPYQYNKKDGGIWYKAFGNIERLQLSQNINTQNNLWGSLVGADFPILKLKNGWSLLPTAYVGYTGAYQTYGGVNMYQNGGQAGIMGTFYKGDFLTSLLANVGGYGNDMYVEGTRDTAGNWFAGVASKSAYNIRLPKDFILQPTMLMSYNAFGGQTWNSSFGDVGLTSGMLNGLNLAPGANLILKKKTWSVYLTTQLMFNLMNGVGGTVGDVTLPTIKMGTTYFQYGIGLTKQFQDRLSAYGQIVMSNGIRTGIGFQGGLQWKF